MLTISKHGHVIHARVKQSISPHIERAPMKVVRGIIIHQTGASTAISSLNSYKNPAANGAHFLIDKDGTIHQTASIHQQTWHVGQLKARCLVELKCTKAETKLLKRFNPQAEHRREMAKTVPQRYPSNHDSIGIEIVGAPIVPKNGSAAESVYEPVTKEQNQSLQWLVHELALTMNIPLAEVFRHPDVSRKNPSEASTAKW